jgi:hypothetical protein
MARSVPQPVCSCPRPILDEDTCVRCGRTVPNPPLTEDVRAQLRSLVKQRQEEERRWMMHAKRILERGAA